MTTLSGHSTPNNPPDALKMTVLDGTTTIRRKVWGRAARRRRKKKIEIMKQVNDLISGGAGISIGRTSSSSCANVADSNRIDKDTDIIPLEQFSLIPKDRNRIWPSVLERRSARWILADDKALKCQLGFSPGNAISIPCRVRSISGLYPELYNLLLRESNIATTIEEKDSVPIVVQLYPVVIRDESEKTRKGVEPTECNQSQQVDNTTPFEIIDPKNQSIEPNGQASLKQDQNADLDLSWNYNSNSLVALEPFPTIYWLTHPVLRSLISGLEVQGYGTMYSKKLGMDPLLLERIRLAHRTYGMERYNLLTASDLIVVEERRWQDVFCYENRGIAGMRYTKQCSRKNKNSSRNGETFLPPIKCLHTHAAHFLSGCSDNVIGQWVMEQLEQNMILLSKNSTTTSALVSNGTSSVMDLEVSSAIL